MTLVSVLIPARNEKLLTNTVESLRARAKADLEFVIVLDGPTEYAVPSGEDVLVIRNPEPVGIRKSIMRAAYYSRGDWLLKVDAHCVFGDEFVRTLLRDCKENEVMVARRWTLDIKTMQPVPRRVDYYYLSCPWTHPHGTLMMQSCPWISRTEARAEVWIDDLLCFQGSMWFMNRAHWDWLKGLRLDMQYAEHHEISFSTWLGGRRVRINKKPWYAHPRERVSGYRMNMEQVYRDHDASARYWIEQPGFFDLIEKFWPFPTLQNRHRTEKYTWPEDWRRYKNDGSV